MKNNLFKKPLLPSLSAVILTKNEESNILQCIDSLNFIDEVIVIDDFSVDETLKKIKQLKNKKISFYKKALDNNFSSQRNFGLSKVKTEWVLFLDPDEVVSKKLAEEINKAIRSNDFNGYYILRQDSAWGVKLLHGETGNLALLRLGRKNSGKWTGAVHEEWAIKGNTSKLKNPIFHYPHGSVTNFLKKVNLYTSIRAQELFRKKVRVKSIDIIVYPGGKFFVNYFLKLGMLDGTQGFIYASIMSFHSFLVRAKVWLLQNTKKK